MNIITKLVILGATLLPSLALAQEDADKKDATIKTYAPDYKYDDAFALKTTIPGERIKAPAVDRRDEVDPIGVQGAMFPSAHIPKTHRFVYRNHLLFGNQLSARVLDNLMLDALVVISPGSLEFNAGGDIDRRLVAQARYRLYHSRNLDIAMQGGIQHQKGLYTFDPRVLSTHLSGQLDYKLSDIFIISAGLLGNLPLKMNYTSPNIDNCKERDDLVFGGCVEPGEGSISMPKGGRFLLGWIGMTLYAPKNIFLKGEIFSTLRRGTIWGIEGAVYNNEPIITEVARYNSTDLHLGPVEGSPLGVNFSAGYTYKRLALQLTLVMLPGALPEVDNRDAGLGAPPPHIFPMSTLALSF